MLKDGDAVVADVSRIRLRRERLRIHRRSRSRQRQQGRGSHGSNRIRKAWAGASPDTLKQLATLEEGLGEPKEAAATLDRINYIYPVDEDLHRQLGELWLAQSNYPGAIREYSAVVAMHPLDRASAQFDLAQAYFAAGQQDKAEDNVLAALEAAPDYRPAQKLLLQLEDSEKGKITDGHSR